MANALNVNKKRLGIIGGAGSLGLVTLLVTLLMTGTALAAFPISGVGGFVVAADKITGEDFKLYPQIGETEERSAWAQAGVDLGTATIEGLVLSKNINTENALGNYGINSVDLKVTSSGGDVEGENLKLLVSGIDAGNASFKGLEVTEHKTDNPLNVIDLEAPTLKLTDAELNTHYLSAGSIGIPGMKLKIIANTEDGPVGDF